MLTDDKFSQLIKSWYEMEFESYKIEIPTIDLSVEIAKSIYTAKCNLYSEGKLISSEDLQFTIPRTLGDTVNSGDSIRVSITLAIASKVLRSYPGRISVNGMYIDKNAGLVDFDKEVFIKIHSFLKYFRLLDKYYPEIEPNSIPDLTQDELKKVEAFELGDREVIKLKLYYKTKNIGRKLNTDIVAKIMDLIDNKDYDELLTPLDFQYLDLTGGLVSDLNRNFEKRVEARRTIRGQVRHYNRVYARVLQTSIDKYFKLQAEFYRSLQSPADDNALSIQAQSRGIYFEDPRNVEKNGDLKIRMYNDYFIGVLDPIMTTEAAQINKTNRLCNAAHISTDGKLLINVLDTNFKELTIPYEDFATSVVLTITNVDYEHKKIHPDEDGYYTVFQYGEYNDITDPSKIEYIFKLDSMVSPNTEPIPFIEYTDTTRGMMAGKHSAQSIPVVGASPMVVYTDGGSKVFDNSSLNIRSEVDGVVTGTYKGEYVKVQDNNGKTHVYHVREYSKSNNNTNNKYNTVVEKGQKVKKGDILFMLNSFIDKEWTTSVPAYCAYTTFHAKEHEDGFVISESLARKLGHPMCEVIEVNLDNELEYKFGDIKFEPDEDHFNKEDYSPFTLIKVGSKVSRNQPLFKYYEYLDQNEDYVRLTAAISGTNESLRLLRTVRVPFQIANGTVRSVRVYNNGRFAERPNDYDFLKYYNDIHEQEVKELTDFAGDAAVDDNIDLGVVNKYKIVIEIEYINTCKLGDKLANFYGSKGVATAIIPDENMPRDESGRPIDIILSPISVPGRKNIGQLYECQLGLICQDSYYKLREALDEKNTAIQKSKLLQLTKVLNLMYNTDKYSKYTLDDWKKEFEETSKYKTFRLKITNFQKYFTDKIVNELSELNGSPHSRRKLYDPISKTWIQNPILTGVTSIRRLHFIVEDRASATGRANESTVPILGFGKVNYRGQKIGEQETWQLLSHGKVKELSDIISENDDKGSQLAAALISLGMKLKRMD